MSVVATSATGACAILLRGEITEAESASLRTMLVHALWRDRHPEVLVEIAHDAVVDATTVGSLVAAAGIADDQNLTLRVTCDNPATRRQLAEAGLTAVTR